MKKKGIGKQKQQKSRYNEDNGIRLWYLIDF